MEHTVSPWWRGAAALTVLVSGLSLSVAGAAATPARTTKAPTSQLGATAGADQRSLPPAQTTQQEPTPITDCSDDKQLQADAAAGGSYVFKCQGEITLTHVITAAVDLTLASPGPNSLTISGNTAAPGCKSGTACQDRAFDIRGGTVTLSGLTIEGTVTGANGASGTGGQSVDPGGGAILVQGGTLDLTDDVITGSYVQAGAGGDGANRGNGGNAGSAGGGAVYVATGATLNADQLTVQNSYVSASDAPIVLEPLQSRRDHRSVAAATTAGRVGRRHGARGWRLRGWDIEHRRHSHL